MLAAYADGAATSALAFLSGAVFFSAVAGGTIWALVGAAAAQHMVASSGSIQNFGAYSGRRLLTRW